MYEADEMTPSLYEDYISKSNVLITGKYKNTLQTLRVMYINLYKIQNSQFVEDPQTSELVVELYPSEIAKMIGLKKGGSIYKSLDPIARQMVSTSIGVTDPENERFDYLAVVTNAHYENGVLTTRFNPRMKKFLLNLKQNFTKLPRIIMMSWKTISAYRLYELLKQRAYYPKTYSGPKNGIFSVTYDVYELRLLLGVVNSNLEAVRRVLDGTNPPDYRRACEASPEKIYESWRELKRSVIDVAVNEINENELSDIEVKYKPMKKAHNEVYAVEFTIYAKALYQKREDNLPEVPVTVKDGEVTSTISQADLFLIQLEAMNLLSPYGINTVDMISICEAAKYDIESIRNAETLLKKQSKVDNVTGWIISAIKNAYQEPVSYKGKSRNQFNNFEQTYYANMSEKELEEICGVFTGNSDSVE